MKIKTNIRVTIDVDWEYTFEHDPVKNAAIIERRAEDLLKQVRRHCDGAQHSHVTWDYECSHCGNNWEWSANEEPQCCGKAQEEWAASREAVQS